MTTIYLAIRCSEFMLVDSKYRAYGHAVAISDNVDNLKHACYLDLVPDFLREQLPDLKAAGVGKWRLCPATTDCHIIADRHGKIHFAIHPIAIAQTIEVQS